MRVFKDDLDKDFHCRQCGRFWAQSELDEGVCPVCETDEDLFLNIDEED